MRFDEPSHPAAAQLSPVRAAFWTKPLLCALIAAIVGSVTTYGVSRALMAQWRDAAQSRFEGRCERVAVGLRRTLDATGTILRGERAAWQHNRTMSADDWRRYIDALAFEQSPLPVRALGLAAVSGATAAPGAPLVPTNVTLFTPAASSHSSGLIGTDRATQDALLRAADTGAPALAARTDAAVDEQSSAGGTLMLYLPVYAVDAQNTQNFPATERRRALNGFLFASLDLRRLVEPIVNGTPALALDIYAADPAHPLYSTDSTSDEGQTQADTALRARRTLTAAGTTLSLAFTANGSPGATGANDALTIVLAAGTVATFVLAAACALAAARWGNRGDTNGEPLDEARMMGIIRSSMEAIITVDGAQHVVIFNPMAERVFGVSAMEAIGAPLSQFIPERYRAAHARHVEQFGVTGVSDRQMGRQRVLYGLRANGEEFPIEASISQVRDARGKLYTVMLRDITERVRADDALRHSREELRELSANLQAAREEEKTRIARELHDDLGQQLTALKMDVSAIEEAVLGTGEAAQDTVSRRARIAGQLGAMRRLIDATVASLRRIAADLRPVMLDDLGLVPAIEWLANDFTSRYGIDIERHLEPGHVNFTSAGATALFRIVQEALTNVARHSEATRVVLTLAVTNDACVLGIADNGRGAAIHAPGTPSQQSHTDKSFGLIGIRERVYLLGGAVTIRSGPDEGFEISATFPLHAVQQEALLS